MTGVTALRSQPLLRHSPWIRKPEAAIVEEVGATERHHRAALEALIRDSEIAGRIRINHVRGRAERAIPGFVRDLEIVLRRFSPTTVNRTPGVGYPTPATGGDVDAGQYCSACLRVRTSAAT